MPLARQSATPRSSPSGTSPHPMPLVSSRPRGWHGIMLEVYRVSDVHLVMQHPQHVVSLFLRGPVDLLQRRNGTISQRVMHAGDVIITPVGEPKLLCHREEAEILKLRLEPSLVESIVEDLGGSARRNIRLLDNFGARDLHIEGLARALLAEAQAEGFASRIYVDSLANQLIVHLLRRYSSAGKLREDRTGRLPRYKLERATDYIDNHLRDDLTLEQIARTVSMSPYHFAHVFKQTVGLTPHRFVTDRRMAQAKSLLRGTTLPITQIAHQVGYSKQSHFSMVFHRLTGQTPRRYRRDA
jgi:AraC family transcriptional regulator